MHHSFLIHSFADGHLGSQHLAIVNCTAMNIGVHRFFWTGFSMELLGQKVVPFLVFWGNSILSSIVGAPVCIPKCFIFKSNLLASIKTKNSSTSYSHKVLFKIFYLILLDTQILKRKFLHSETVWFSYLAEKRRRAKFRREPNSSIDSTSYRTS